MLSSNTCVWYDADLQRASDDTHPARIGDRRFRPGCRRGDDDRHEGRPPGLVLPEGAWEQGSVEGTILETGEVLRDRLHLESGRFQSARCQEYCDFDWSEYRTRTEGDVIYFTTTTRCPGAPHSVVWYGTVTGDEVRFEGTWTTRRWYRTRHLNAVGEGSATPPAHEELRG